MESNENRSVERSVGDAIHHRTHESIVVDGSFDAIVSRYLLSLFASRRANDECAIYLFD